MKQTPDDTSSSCYPDQPQTAVGAIVFRKGKVLLVLRGKPPGADLWAIPGGRIALGETLRAAAEREIKEETGITIRAGDPIVTFEVIEKDEQGRIRFHYIIIDLAADYVSGEIRPGDDAADARWVAPGELKDLNVSPNTLKVLRRLFDFGV